MAYLNTTQSVSFVLALSSCPPLVLDHCGCPEGSLLGVGSFWWPSTWIGRWSPPLCVLGWQFRAETFDVYCFYDSASDLSVLSGGSWFGLDGAVATFSWLGGFPASAGPFNVFALAGSSSCGLGSPFTSS